MTRTLTILGLESSCDDTSAAVIRQTDDAPAEILSNIIYGQTELHAAFGGVVPEIAARAHAEKLDLCVEEAISEAEVSLENIDAIAVTAGPGLIRGVLSGVMCAKGLAAGLQVPLIGVNHLAGHALTPRLTDQVAYPYLMLLVSGCLLYTSDAADDMQCVDLGGRRIIKKAGAVDGGLEVGAPGCALGFFQAEDGIRDVERSRGLGDVYKRQG